MVKEESKETKRAQGLCPWCEYDNKDEEKGPIHEKTKEASKLIEDGKGKQQCLTCGKVWEKAALGKPWTIELERGSQWARENQIRKLQGF
jgi:hypothetical protein